MNRFASKEKFPKQPFFNWISCKSKNLRAMDGKNKFYFFRYQPSKSQKCTRTTQFRQMKNILIIICRDEFFNFCAEIPSILVVPINSKDNNGHSNSTSRNTVNLHTVSVNMIINTNTLHTIPTYRSLENFRLELFHC